MRMRKKKNADARLASHEGLVLTCPEAPIGRAEGREIYLEIGAGKGGFAIEMAKRNPTVSYFAMERVTDCVVLAAEKAKAMGREKETNLELDDIGDSLMLTHEVYDKLIEKNLRQPTFVTRLPHEFVPLAKTCKDDPALVDVFEFVVGGRELCPGYTEQNDPLEQRKALEHQAGEDTEKIDEDFISALECGMPPTGGLGIGIDRLVMLLTGCDGIRDVVLFPQMKN